MLASPGPAPSSRPPSTPSTKPAHRLPGLWGSSSRVPEAPETLQGALPAHARRSGLDALVVPLPDMPAPPLPHEPPHPSEPQPRFPPCAPCIPGPRPGRARMRHHISSLGMYLLQVLSVWRGRMPPAQYLPVLPGQSLILSKHLVKVY